MAYLSTCPKLLKALSGFVLTFFISSISIFIWVNAAVAVDIDAATRTVPWDETGEEITFSIQQLAQGQRKFNQSCAQCHLDGVSKPNPDVDLSTQTLGSATPARDNVASLLDYFNNPTTYDGLASLAELHPSTAQTDLFPKMRDLTEDDLTAIAGYILVQPKIIGDQWAGGKPKR